MGIWRASQKTAYTTFGSTISFKNGKDRGNRDRKGAEYWITMIEQGGEGALSGMKSRLSRNWSPASRGGKKDEGVKREMREGSGETG